MNGIKEIDFDSSNLMKIVPQKVKIEVIKDEMAKVYSEELNFKRLLESNNINDVNQLFFHNAKYYEILVDLNNLRKSYLNLFSVIKTLNLSEENLEKIYQWAKVRRQELGLSSNLYNIYEFFIDKSLLYQEVNNKIDKSQKFL